MISDFCLPFDALTKHTFSTKLTKRQGRREQGTMTSHCPLSFLPSMLLSTGSTPQHVIVGCQPDANLITGYLLQPRAQWHSARSSAKKCCRKVRASVSYCRWPDAENSAFEMHALTRPIVG
jgi:hypothetical protein